MARQARTLVQLILERGYRPAVHGNRLLGPHLSLSPPHPDTTPAMSRLWNRLRQLQVEYGDMRSVELRHDLSRDFGKVAAEYMAAVSYARLDPMQDVEGLAELVGATREAKRRWEEEQASSP